jgi:serpin B
MSLKRGPTKSESRTPTSQRRAWPSWRPTDLYGAIRDTDDGNVIFSPFSISTALAMTYAGARGTTEEQMASALRWMLGQSELHPAFNKLDLLLSSRSAGPSQTLNYDEGEGERPKLNIANSLWGERQFEFLQEYLDTIALNYGAGLRLVDFMNDPEGARVAINDWVSEETEERIKDLIPPGAINDLTRLVLANAIYFNASWLEPFDVERTADGPFHLIGGSEVTVPLMEATLRTNYTELDGVQAVELRYFGSEASFVILLPEEGEFESFEQSLDGDTIDELIGSFSAHDVDLKMPKFEFESTVGLRELLQSLGMEAPFDPDEADFSGMAPQGENLYVSDVFHKAFISLDESGTEASAATAVIVGLTSAFPQAEVTADRPFIFLNRDKTTDTILFMGRVLDPS